MYKTILLGIPNYIELFRQIGFATRNETCEDIREGFPRSRWLMTIFLQLLRIF